MRHCSFVSLVNHRTKLIVCKSYHYYIVALPIYVEGQNNVIKKFEYPDYKIVFTCSSVHNCSISMTFSFLMYTLAPCLPSNINTLFMSQLGHNPQQLQFHLILWSILHIFVQDLFLRYKIARKQNLPCFF